eukprot:CAMPEP_0172534666 /NCGR_PEP_ID=MMETSP1067-20121228/6944_1 /TAXON_ID=265564 ORGANISM="Thalassiosira punctigera, Strain Tpunct2005C2" /NCGR_SAMPLE_ID=MMETSP1067 /ASSEMBLY_ACC=CAM_ASM_000444 /LENGTH=172 /DNA_ID=CAMNT_0013319481 /DNA_START=72 /DNA_END=590 /DNA_ORIENTATION=+
MCTTHSASHCSANIEMIDRLIQELDGAMSPANDGAGDPLDSLSSSLQEVHANFGIFDSLTLVQSKANPKAKDPKESGDLEEPMMSDQEEADEDKKALRDFDSNWDNAAMTLLPVTYHHSTRRSGIRRGQQHQSIMGPAKVMIVPTKVYDGPSSDKLDLMSVSTKQPTSFHNA